MPEPLFDDLPVLGELGASLRAAMVAAEAGVVPAPARSTPPTRRPRGRFGWLGSFLVLGLVGTAAAAGTLTLLRGSPIPGPRAEDSQPSMTPKRDSLHVLGLRAGDPDGANRLPFALRIGESEAGQSCVTVGQADGDDFGIVGEDNRFRAVAPTIVDGCGDRTTDDAAVLGARVFAADRWKDVRTVVYGSGLPDDARDATLSVRGRTRAVAISGHAFAVALRGYPEDSATTLRFRTGDGRTITHPLGKVPNAITDPAGPAWRVASYGSTSARHAERFCVDLTPLRLAANGPEAIALPTMCVSTRLRGRSRSARPAVDYLLMRRTFARGQHGRDEHGSTWHWTSPTRSVVWGWARRSQVVAVHAVQAGHATRLRRTQNGEFALLAAPGSRPISAVVLTLRSGRTLTLRHPGISKGTL